MKIKYTYNVLRVDVLSKVMEVKYESPEHGAMHVYARLPYENEPLESVIDQYAPINYWIDKDKPVQNIDPETSYGVRDYSNEPTEDAIINEIRLMRNQLLLLSDYTQLSDAPASIDKEAWQAYRQALREITLQPNFPNDIVWPNPPV